MCIRRVCPFDKVHPLLQSDQGQHARLVMNLRVRYGHLWVCVGEVRRPSPRLVSNPRLAAVLRQAEGTDAHLLGRTLRGVALGHPGDTPWAWLLVDRTMVWVPTEQWKEFVVVSSTQGWVRHTPLHDPELCGYSKGGLPCLRRAALPYNQTDCDRL